MALHIVSGVETINSTTSYPDGISIPTGTTLILEDGTDLDTPFINITGTLSATGIGVNDSVKIKLAGDRAVPTSGNDPTEGRIMVMTGGNLLLKGPDANLKTPFTRLLSTVNITDDTIVVGGVIGWKVGDTLGISQSTMYAWETEERTIIGISITAGVYTLTLNSALYYSHYGSNSSTYDITTNGKTKTMDVRTVVSNLSRPIEVYTDAADAYGAHIMKMTDANSLVLIGTQLSRLGMSEPSTFPYQPFGDTGGPYDRFDSPSGSGLPGKYSVHWHHNGDNSIGDYCKNVVTYRSRHKSFVIHDSNGVLLEDNVAYRGWNHQFSLGEDGRAQDCVVNRNLVQYFRRMYNGSDPGTNDTDFAFKSNGGSLRENRVAGGSWQNEMHPGAFWITTPSITMRDNIVSGGIAGIGFYFDFVGSRDDGTFLELDPSVEYDTMIFERNQASSIIAEGGHKFGTTNDLIQGINYTSVAIGFSYRTSGFALWMDQFDPDRPTTGRGSFEYLVNDFKAYSCTGFVWSESPAFRLSDFAGFHIGTAGMAMGGFWEDGVILKRDLLKEDESIIADTRNPALHPNFGNLSDDTAHYEGYFLNRGLVSGATVLTDMTNVRTAAFNVWSTDKTGGMKLFKRMHSIKNVYVDGYINYIRITHAHEGPFYLTDWNIDNKDPNLNATFDRSDIVVDLGQDGLGNTDGLTSGKGPAPHSQTSDDGQIKYQSTNQFNAGLFDLDNNLLYTGDGTTLAADKYYVVRVTSRSSDVLGIIANKADGAATWYDTNHALTYRQVHEMYDISSTAIKAIGSNLTYTSSAVDIQIDAYGSFDGAEATINSNAVTYNANNYRDGFNVNYLLGDVQPPVGTNNATNVFAADLYVDSIIINTVSTPLFT